MEAITKFALNSTLFEDDFEPLDQIIKSKRSLVASDNYYIIHYSGKKYKMNCGGSLKLKAEYKATYGNDIKVTLYKNETQIKELRVGYNNTEEYAFSFEKGDIIRLSRGTGSTDAGTFTVSLCGNVVDATLYEEVTS